MTGKKQYKFIVNAEVQTPLHDPETGETLDLDIASKLICEIGYDDNGGMGFGYRDASGETRFETLEQARAWVDNVLVRLEKLFPKEKFTDCPPRAFIWPVVWDVDDEEDDWHADFTDDWAGIEWEDEVKIHYVPLAHCQMVKVDPPNSDQILQDNYKSILAELGEKFSDQLKGDI